MPERLAFTNRAPAKPVSVQRRRMAEYCVCRHHHRCRCCHSSPRSVAIEQHSSLREAKRRGKKFIKNSSFAAAGLITTNRRAPPPHPGFAFLLALIVQQRLLLSDDPDVILPRAVRAVEQNLEKNSNSDSSPHQVRFAFGLSMHVRDEFSFHDDRSTLRMSHFLVID